LTLLEAIVIAYFCFNLLLQVIKSEDILVPLHADIRVVVVLEKQLVEHKLVSPVVPTFLHV